MKTNSLLLGGLTLLLAAQSTFAFSSYRSRIPNGTTPPSPTSCIVCHQADGPPLNDFGADFDSPPSGTSRQWSTVLAMLDSDGDGYSNGAELGDPNGTWVAGQANPPGPIFDPGDSNSHPTAANVPPTATLTGPANGATFTAPASVTLTANATDSDGTVTLVEFLSGTTVIGSDASAPFSFAWNGVAVGAYSLSARATDNAGATTTSAAVSITVNPPANIPPTANLTGPADGATFIAPASVTLTASAADSDGTITLVEFLSGTTVIGSDASAPFSFAWNGVAVGAYSLSARATDNSGATTTSAAVSVTVNPPVNIPPTANLTGPADGATFIAPASVTLTANATDSDGTVTLVEFLSGTTVIGSDATAPYEYAWNGVPASSYSLSIRATDNNGATTTSAAVSITVNPPDNVPPTVNLTGPVTGATFIAPANVVLTAEAADSDGTVTSVEFLSGPIVLGTDTTAPYSFAWNGVAAGTYSLSARATDSSGATTTAAAVMIAVNNAVVAPAITQHPESRTVNAGETVTFQVSATGTPPLAYQWQKNGVDLSDGGNISGANGTVLTIANVTSADQDEYRAVVSNVADSDTSNPATLTVTTEPPQLTITLTAPADGTLYTAPADIPLSASVSPEAGIAGVEFFEGTNLLVTLITAPFAIIVTNVPEGDYVFTARVTDTAGETATSDSATVHVQAPGANQPPSVQILRPRGGERFRSGRNVVIVAAASDADGTVERVEFFAGTDSLGLATLVQRDEDDDDREDEGKGGRHHREKAALWVLTWTNAPVGEHFLTALATDNSNATTTSSSVAVTVQAPPPPKVKITATDSSASVRGTNINTATFEVRRNDVNGSLVVHYTVAGTAANGVNYVTLPGSVTIPAGERVVRVQVVPLPVALAPEQRRLRLTVVVTLSPSATTPPAYTIEERPSARAIITYQSPRGDEDDD